MLSILASGAIALPLSPSFPISELSYILNNSQAEVLLATEKYAGKAGQLVREELDKVPVLEAIGKRKQGAPFSSKVDLHDVQHPQDGMMLYTSGTTNRPVRQILDYRDEITNYG